MLVFESLFLSTFDLTTIDYYKNFCRLKKKKKKLSYGQKHSTERLDFFDRQVKRDTK